MAITTESEHGQYVLARVKSERAGWLMQFGALAIAVASITGAALLQRPINAERVELQLVSHSNVYKDLPPIYVLAGAAGGPVRAITSIVLWIRAERLKEEGKYFQSDNLARWICTLQPRFPTVWVNRAWDLAYNISVGCHTREERWQWVYNGIRLLRDEGIPNNDRYVALYQQLAWIWFHKVGDRLDDFHNSYKRQWAANMEILLGAPPVGLSDEATINAFKPVAEAPATLDRVVAAHPGVAKLVSSLDGLGIDVNATTDNNRMYHPLETRFFRPYTAWAMARSLSLLRSQSRQPSAEEAALAAVLDQTPKDDLDALLAFLRAKVLREQYKMDPQFMLKLTGMLNTDKPVPIDWRTPWSQAIYWAIYGVQKGRELKTVREFDLIATDRVLVFSLEHMRKSGRYTFRLDLDSPMDSYLVGGPDMRYLEALHKTYVKIGPEHADEGEKLEGNRTAEILRTGHINFLREATIDFYLAGKEDKAREWFDYLRNTYKDEYTKKMQVDYAKGLKDFVDGQIADKVDNYLGCMNTVASLLARSYESLAAGDMNDYTQQVAMAGNIYGRYQGDKVEDPEGRRTLPPFLTMRAKALTDYVAPADGRLTHPVIYSVWVWQREQEEVKRACYDDLVDEFEQLAKLEGLDVQKAFPPPAGMEDWRKAHPAPKKQEDIVKETEAKKKAEQEKK